MVAIPAVGGGAVLAAMDALVRDVARGRCILFVGVIMPAQRLRALEVRRVKGVENDPEVRYWLRCEPAT